MKKKITILLLMGLLASPIMSYDMPSTNDVRKVIDIFNDVIITTNKKTPEPVPPPKKEEAKIKWTLTEIELNELLEKSYNKGKLDGIKEGYKEGLKEGYKEGLEEKRAEVAKQ